MFMMLAHGITSAGMFFLVGVIYDRAHTRDLNKLGGLNNIMPLYGAISYIIFFGSMGLPGLCGFVAEVFVVLAAFNYSIRAGGPGRRGGDPDGRLHPLDPPARLPGPERDLEGPARHEPPRDRHRRAAGGADHRHGRLPAAARLELDGPLGRPDGPEGHHGPRANVQTARRPGRPRSAVSPSDVRAGAGSRVRVLAKLLLRRSGKPMYPAGHIG